MKYAAIAILPDGTEAERLWFEWDASSHESYHAMRPSVRDVYLAIDAPGVADFARRYIEPGYLEPVVSRAPQGDLVLLICDENGIAKGLPLNITHDLTRWYAEHSTPLLGTIVAVQAVA